MYYDDHISAGSNRVKGVEVSKPETSSSTHHHEANQINLEIINKQQRDNQERLRNIQSIIVQIAEKQNQRGAFTSTDWLCLGLLLFIQTVFSYFITRVAS